MDYSTFEKLPKHIAFILDGNGRWAKKRGLERTQGHIQGVKTLKKIVEEVKKLTIPYMSVYVFSVENFSRPKEEVDFLMKTAIEEFSNIEKDLDKLDFNVRVIGERDNLNDQILNVIDKINSTNFINNRFTLFIAFNYSSQLEIINAAKRLNQEGLEYNKENLEKYLYTYPAPLIDLLIRTSNELRLSNFMLYQASYAELYFPKVYWPAFNKKALYKALEEYQKRERKFGNIKEK